MRRAWLGWLFAAMTPMALWCGCSSTPPDSPADAGVMEASTRDTGVSDVEAVDASTACSPRPLTNFVPTWKPPTGYPRAACTDADIAAIVAGCETAKSTQATCTPAVAAHKACGNCIFTDENAPVLGPSVYYAKLKRDIVNEPGCAAIILGDVSPTGCGAAGQALYQCDERACALCDTTAGNQPFYDCENLAENDLASCRPTSDNAAFVCVGNYPPQCTWDDANEFYEVYAQRVYTIFCGGLGTDAGTDAPSDSPEGG